MLPANKEIDMRITNAIDDANDVLSDVKKRVAELNTDECTALTINSICFDLNEIVALLQKHQAYTMCAYLFADNELKKEAKQA